MAKVLLIGLDPRAAQPLRRALEESHHQIEHCRVIPGPATLLTADIVFASAESNHYRAFLKQVRAERLDLPVVIVTRVPETSDWLDALEAGATDYCSAPFEASQIRWLIESALPHAGAAAAAA